MASNEILHSTLEADLRAASNLTRTIDVLLTHNASIRRTGYIPRRGSVNGFGSDTMRVRQAGLGGADSFASATEIEDVAETALTDSSFTLAVSRYALVREISDLAVLTGYPGGDIDPDLLAADMVDGFEELFNAQVATAGATASSNVGSSGVDMSVDDAYDAIYTLELASCPGPFFAVLHPRQLADLQESLRGESGVNSWQAASADMVKIKGQGFSGSWLGVDWFHDPNITAAGGNREGFMAGIGAIQYADGMPLIQDNRLAQFAGSPIVVEFDRTATMAKNIIVGHAYLAVSVAEQSRLVGIVTDQ